MGVFFAKKYLRMKYIVSVPLVLVLVLVSCKEEGKNFSKAQGLKFSADNAGLSVPEVFKATYQWQEYLIFRG